MIHDLLLEAKFLWLFQLHENNTFFSKLLIKLTQHEHFTNTFENNTILLWNIDQTIWSNNTENYLHYELKLE